MSFARNFALGQQIAQTALDTYETAREKSRLRGISEAKPTEIENAYTTQDAEQLRALANAKDAQGNPYYSLQANPDGSYGLKTNFEYQGQDGQMVQPGGVATTFAPRSSAVEFMGTRYAPEDLNEDRLAALRARAMADVIAERDPVRGLQMRRAVKSDEREDKRFAWEEQQQPLKQRQLEQQTRQGEITLGKSERELKVQELTDEVAKMPLEAIQQYAARLNTNQSNLPFLHVGQTKEGYKFLAFDPNTGSPLGKEFTVNEAQLRELATASVLGMAGYGAESMAKLTAVNKDIADIVSKMNATVGQTVTSYNDAVHKGNQNKIEQGKLGVQRGQLGVAQERLKLERNPLKQKIETLQGFLKRELTEPEIKALGGLSTNSGLKFNEVDGSVVFTDANGAPVGKLDGQLGLIPYGADPRADQRLLRTLQQKGVQIATGQTTDGMPTWVYVHPSGRRFTTPEEALNPPIRNEDVQDLSALKQLLDQKRSQLVAASRSGDQRAIAPLAQEVQGLQRTYNAAARERFGDRTDEYLRNY